MHKHVFKVSKDGEFSGKGKNYDCKCLSKENVSDYIDDGWYLSLDEAINAASKKAKTKAVEYDVDSEQG